MKKKISVVIPTYNEEGNVKPLAECRSDGDRTSGIPV